MNKKYAVGFFANPGIDPESKMQSITHTEIVGLEKNEGKLPTVTAMWKKYKDQLKDCKIYDKKIGGKRNVKKSDLFIVESSSSLYSRTHV